MQMGFVSEELLKEAIWRQIPGNEDKSVPLGPLPKRLQVCMSVLELNLECS